MTRTITMVSTTFSSIRFTCSYLIEHHLLLFQAPMFCSLFIALSFVSLLILSLLIFKRLKRTKVVIEEEGGEKEKVAVEEPASTAEKSIQNPQPNFRYPSSDTTGEDDQIHPLILEILTSDPSKLASFISSVRSPLPSDESGKFKLFDVSKLNSDDVHSISEDTVKTDDSRGKKKKKRARKKRQNSLVKDSAEDGFSSLPQDKNDLDDLYPFTSLSSVTQKKIKQQYDQLVKAHDAQALTLTQVCHFANCLIEARNELKHKSEVNQRKFSITKALLFKADRSSFDRLSQQVYKLEAEQKRLEEDAVVYNRLQQQLKLSPAYKKMLEIGSLMELEAASDHPIESTDTDFADISFEELLAQEKKDAFWQKNGKLRLSTS